MKRTATIETNDLGLTLDYLQGLEEMLSALSDGNAQPHVLLDRLQTMDAERATTWAPLRYETATHHGWQYVADNLSDLRQRLVQAYERAALG